MYSLPINSQASCFDLGLQQYLLATNTVLGIANRRNSKIWMDLATDVTERRMTVKQSYMMPQVRNESGSCCPYVPNFIAQNSPFSGSSQTPSVKSGCAFSFFEMARGELKNRDCGNTSNHISSPDEIVRSYCGTIWQYDSVLNNFCCDSAYRNANKEDVIFSHLQSFLDALFLKIDQAFSSALFDVVAVCKNNNAPEYRTFSQDATAIGNLTAALSLTNVQNVLNSLLATSTARSYTYYWLVPLDVYALISSFAGSTQTSRSVYPAFSKDGTPLRNALMIDMVSDVIVIGMDKSLFTEKSGADIITPLIPAGSIGFSWMKPSEFSLDPAARISKDLLSQYQTAALQATGMNFELPVTMRYVEESQAINWNNQLVALSTFVAGRIVSQYAPMFGIKVSNTPTAAAIASQNASIQALTASITAAIQAAAQHPPAPAPTPTSTGGSK